MSSPRRNAATVSREYAPDPERGIRALTLLLEKPLSKEGGPDTAPDEGERSSNEFASTKKHTR